MKKLALAVASVLLAGTVFAFAGCDDGSNVGVVKGNYKEATAAEVTSACENIDFENAFGDMTAEDFKFGFEAKADISFALNYSVSANSQTISEMKTDGDLEANYQLVIAPEDDWFTIAGKGEVSASASSTQSAMGQSSSSKSEVSASAYMDSEYLYLDAHMSAGENKNDMKVKVAFETIFEGIIGGIGGEFSMLADEEDGDFADGDIVEIETDFNLQTILKTMMDAGLTVSLDQSSGLKIKISADEEFILAAIEDSDFDLPISLEGLEFSSSEFAIYLHFDENGKFVQAGVNMNIEAELNVSQSGTGTSVKVSVKGGVEIKTFTGTVTLPNGLATDDSYVEMEM